MKEIKLTRGYVALVDDEDYETVASHNWTSYIARRTNGEIRAVYAIANVYKKDGGRTTMKMHRLITGAPHGKEVDHIDGNGLNNMRHNLRVCTKSENQHNIRVSWGKSKFKGVCWMKDRSKWCAKINVYGKRINLGFFISELDAAKAYDVAALRLFGDFACTNAYD